MRVVMVVVVVMESKVGRARQGQRRRGRNLDGIWCRVW